MFENLLQTPYMMKVVVKVLPEIFETNIEESKIKEKFIESISLKG